MAVVGTAVLELLGDTGQFRREMTGAVRVFDRIGLRLTAIGASLTRTVTLPVVALGTAVVVAGTKMDTLRRALTAVAGSSEEANRQFEDLREVAKLPGLGLAEAVEGSVRLQAVGLSADVATRALKAFGNAIATTGGGASELARVTVQLGQLSAKGRILTQDLRPIIEAAPAVGRALREAFGTVDPQEIEALGLTTDQFLDRLISQLEKLPRVTGGPRNAFENLRDAALQAGDAIAVTFLPAVTAAVERLSGFLESVRNVNPEVIRWSVALAGAAAVIGPLSLALGGLITAASLLATTLSLSLLPLIATGGGIIVGLTALLALLIKVKISTADAATEFDRFVASTRALSRAQLEETIRKTADAYDELARSQEHFERASEAARIGGDRGEADRLAARARELEKQAIATALQLSTYRTRLGELDQAAPKATTTTTTQVKANEDLADAIKDLHTALRITTDMETILGDRFDSTAERASVLRSAIENLVEAGARLDTVVGPQGETVRQLAAQYDALETSSEAVAEREKESNKLKSEAESLTRSLLTAEEQREAAISRAAILLNAGAISQETFNRRLTEANVAFAQTLPAARALTETFARYRDVLTGITGPQRQFFTDTAILFQLFTAGAITVQQFGEQMSNAMKGLRSTVEELITPMEALGDAAAATAIRGVESFIDFTGRAKASFKDFVNQALTDLARLAVRLAIVSAFPGLAPIAGLSGVGFRAHGGPVHRGRPYVVGERGPELFVPSQSGSVVANDRLGAAGGPMTIRLDTSSLPPMPSLLTPDAVATSDWWRRAFSHLKLDYDARGGR